MALQRYVFVWERLDSPDEELNDFRYDTFLTDDQFDEVNTWLAVRLEEFRRDNGLSGVPGEGPSTE